MTDRPILHLAPANALPRRHEAMAGIAMIQSDPNATAEQIRAMEREIDEAEARGR